VALDRREKEADGETSTSAQSQGVVGYGQPPRRPRKGGKKKTGCWAVKARQERPFWGGTGRRGDQIVQCPPLPNKRLNSNEGKQGKKRGGMQTPTQHGAVGEDKRLGGRERRLRLIITIERGDKRVGLKSQGKK